MHSNRIFCHKSYIGKLSLAHVFFKSIFKFLKITKVFNQNSEMDQAKK